MGSEIRELLGRMNLRLPATDAAVEACASPVGGALPAEYVEFLNVANGGEGFIGEAYVIFWGVDELVCLNQAYEVHEYAPGLFIFGSSGGGEAYGFDTRDAKWPVVQIPFVGMAWELAQPMGTSFLAFLRRLEEAEGRDESALGQKPVAVECRDTEIFEITPIILGGSPMDPANKVIVDRQKHIELAAFWNKTIRNVREKR